MNDNREDIDLVTEERLRRAVRFRDAEVTTSPDALDRIRRHTARRSSPPWLRPGVLVGAAAAVLVVVAGIAFAFQRDDDTPDVATDTDTATDPAPSTSQQPAGDDAPPTTTTSSPPPSTTVAPVATPVPPLPEISPRERAESGLIVWPLDSRSFEGATNAAWSYATQALGIDDPELTIECCEDGVATVTIAQRAEDGSSFGEATRIDVVALDEFNWVVVGADSPEVTIGSIQLIDEGLAFVTGSGRAFEGSARIVARSICDPEGTISPTMVGGGPDFADFTEAVAFVPCDAPLVVELSTDEILDIGVPFVTALAYTGPVVEPEWAVMRVEPGDVLNVRSGPGVENDIVTTLARDERGFLPTGSSGESGDGQTWVEIVTGGGIAGWVNSSYVTAQAELSDAAAESLALDAIAFLAGGNDGSLVFDERGVHVGGIGVFADAYSPFVFVDDEAFLTDRDVDWSPFPDDPCESECVMSTREFLDVAAIAQRVRPAAEGGVVRHPSFEPQFQFGPSDQLDLFDTLRSVTIEIEATNDGDLDWRRYHMWFDWSDGRPRVIAVWRWGWTP